MKLIIIALFIILPVLSMFLSNTALESIFLGLVVGVFLDLILMLAGVRIVRQNTVQVVEFLGKFNRVLHSGFNVVIPFLERTKVQALFKRNIQVMVDGLTGDNVTVRVGLNVVYFVKNTPEDIYSSIYEIDNPETLIRATIDE
jgi:regulator of protease activity HflC (stomatin/prohibitin superfamily)